MINRLRAVVMVLTLLVPITAAAQASQPATKKPANWTKKTPAGQPDLQGFWSSSTTTPLERDPNCGTKEFWTDEEMAKGVRTCAAAASTGQRGRGAAPAAGGQRGRGQ